jgi:hypothetical protein
MGRNFNVCFEGTWNSASGRKRCPKATNVRSSSISQRWKNEAPFPSSVRQPILNWSGDPDRLAQSETKEALLENDWAKLGYDPFRGRSNYFLTTYQLF